MIAFIYMIIYLQIKLKGCSRQFMPGMGTRVRHQLRIIPELKFFVDDSLDYLERIDELLK